MYAKASLSLSIYLSLSLSLYIYIYICIYVQYFSPGSNCQPHVVLDAPIPPLPPSETPNPLASHAQVENDVVQTILLKRIASRFSAQSQREAY